jgi:AraC-like DNA-binding protein
MTSRQRSASRGALTSRTFWSTDDLPPTDRFAFWREAVLAPLGMTAEPDAAIPAAFSARVLQRSGGPLMHTRVEADSHRVLRRERDIARRQRHGYSIYREIGDGAWFEYSGEEFVTCRGDIVVTDADTPWQTQPVGCYRLDTLLLPKRLLAPHLPAFGRSMSLRLNGRAGAEALAAGYLDAVMQQWEFLDAGAMEGVADTLCRLLGIAAGGAVGGHREAVRAAQLAAAKRYIDRHLAEGELSPARVAAALGLSVRSLHLLFEPTGTSFARHVMRRRLEECRAALTSPAGATRSVTDIALGWGFNSLPAFYRAFRREFGAAPGELRAVDRLR